MDTLFSSRGEVPSHVLCNEVQGELVLLNLDTEKYFGLDQTGTAMWKAVTGLPTIERAYQELSATYRVEPEELRADLKDLLQELIRQGLLETVAGRQ